MNEEVKNCKWCCLVDGWVVGIYRRWEKRSRGGLQFFECAHSGYRGGGVFCIAIARCLVARGWGGGGYKTREPKWRANKEPYILSISLYTIYFLKHSFPPRARPVMKWLSARAAMTLKMEEIRIFSIFFFFKQNICIRLLIICCGLGGEGREHLIYI